MPGKEIPDVDLVLDWFFVVRGPGSEVTIHPLRSLKQDITTKHPGGMIVTASNGV